MESKRDCVASAEVAAPVRLSRARCVVLCWRAGAGIALLLGGVGVLLPVMPTVPFIIVAAWAAQRGWPELEQRLLDHETFGPHILAWRQRRAIPRRAKWLATAMMSCSALLMAVLPLIMPVKAAIWLCFGAVGLWMWTRPE